MGALDPHLKPTPRQRLLSWLGLSADVPPHEFGAITPSLGAEPSPPAAQRQMLANIGDFLTAHRLELTGFTLATVHDYLTGVDSQLRHRIDTRIQQRQPLTREWLEDTARDDHDDPRETFQRLMNSLEGNIDAFGKATLDAHSATSSYSTALSAHVGALHQRDEKRVTELVHLAGAMLERTLQMEQDLFRSTQQTRSLRRSLEQARRSADRDHLTGLPNRRAFDAYLASESASARSAGDKLCVAFCDIDHFKRINDEHGHEAGDRVLRAVASTLAGLANPACHVARHGGEEFTVLLRGVDLQQAWDTLDGARVAMAERRLVNRTTDRPFGKITFSGGIADVLAFSDPQKALRAADRALYRAKAEGRNRIVMACPMDAPARGAFTPD